ncbi:kinesin motor domain containing protein, partial [Trypanosoma theileri]
MTIHRVQCFVRVRPLLEGERVREENEDDYLLINTDEQRVLIGHHHSYRFDRVFDPTIPLHHICNTVVVGMVQGALKGLQKALLLYGPTGGGKSYTMNQIIPVALQLLLQIADSERIEYETTITLECVQIYLECISDLIDPSKNDLQLREFPDTGVYVRGATQLSISSLEEFNKIWEKIATSRFRGTTPLNSSKSKGSHCVINLRVKRRRRIDSRFEEVSCLNDDNVSSSSFITDGRICIVDLAGSDRLRESDTIAIDQGTPIRMNQSLAVLRNVMNALADPKKTHVPFRDSKLTRLLQEPLGRGGSCNILVCISQSPIKIHDTGLALAFGVKAMSIVQNSESKKSIDHTSYLEDVQKWLANRVHMLERELRHLTLKNPRQCSTCIEKEIKILEISQQLSSLKAQTIYTEKEYNVTLRRLRDALETTQNDCEHYRRKAMKKCTIIDETSNERKLLTLNEYWTGYTESLQQDLETAERERDEACAELFKLSTEITQLRLQHNNTCETQKIDINNNRNDNNDSVYINIDQDIIPDKTSIENATKHQQQQQKEHKQDHIENKRATRDSVTLRAELSDAQQRAKELESAACEVESLRMRCRELQQTLEAVESRSVGECTGLRDRLAAMEENMAALRAENRRATHDSVT